MRADWKGQSHEENESVTLCSKEISNQISRISFLNMVEQKNSPENHLNITEGMRGRKGEKYGKTEGKGCDQYHIGTKRPFHAFIQRKRPLENLAVCGKAPVGRRCLYPAAEKVPGADAAM